MGESKETTLAKLYKTLAYWNKWTFEYLGLQEEFQDLSHDATPDEMVKIGLAYKSEVIDEKEIKSVIQYSSKPCRTKAQVIRILAGRAETGSKNVETLQKQIDKWELEFDDSPSTGEGLFSNDEGDNLMELAEELDDEGNILSSTVLPFRQAAEDVDSFIELVEQKAMAKTPGSNTTSTPEAKSQKLVAKTINEIESKEPAHQIAPIPMASKVEPPVVPDMTSRNINGTAKIIESESSSDQGASVATVAQVPDPKVDSTTIPDAKLHPTSSKEEESSDLDMQREFSQNLRQINPIVTTMNLESDDDEDNEDDEDENEYGMTSIRDEMTEDYIRDMQALIDKHADSPYLEANSRSSASTKIPLHHQLNPVASASKPLATSKIKSMASKASKSSGVRFADVLDVAPSTLANAQPPQAARSIKRPAKPDTAHGTMANTIVERFSIPTASTSTLASTLIPPRVSKFRTARTGDLVSTNTAASAASEDEIEKANDFRNEMALYRERIKSRPFDEKGFHGENVLSLDDYGNNDDDDDEQEDEEEEQQPRMSRYKAAKLGLDYDMDT